MVDLNFFTDAAAALSPVVQYFLYPIIGVAFIATVPVLIKSFLRS